MSPKWQRVLLIFMIAAAGCGSIRPRPSATPDSTTPQFFSQEVGTDTPVIVITPTPVVIAPATDTQNPTPNADQDESEGGGGLVSEIIDGFIIPIWNFLLTLTVGTAQALWKATGERGGIEAQAMCCAFPAILLVLAIGRSVTMQRRRK
jgi:PAB1-binding protein PBP1